MSKSKLLRIYTIHRCLVTKRKIFPRKMAKNLGISRATLFRDLDVLKSIGAPVRYCRISQIRRDFHMSKEEFFEKIL